MCLMSKHSRIAKPITDFRIILLKTDYFEVGQIFEPFIDVKAIDYERKTHCKNAALKAVIYKLCHELMERDLTAAFVK